MEAALKEPGSGLTLSSFGGKCYKSGIDLKKKTQKDAKMYFKKKHLYFLYSCSSRKNCCRCMIATRFFTGNILQLFYQERCHPLKYIDSRNKTKLHKPAA